MPKAPATAKVIAASWRGGTLPVAAVNSAKSDHSAIAPRPVRVALREDIRGWSRLRRGAVKLRGGVLRGSPGSEAGVAPQDEEAQDGPNADFLMLRCEPEASLEARTSMAHAMYWPPLIDSVEPVMKPPSSEARKTTARPISSGVPRRPTGICGMIFVFSTSGSIACTISVPM